MILNLAQAEAVYSAMCALNNVGGVIRAEIGDIVVEQKVAGRLSVIDWGSRPSNAESYDSQSAFAAAYSLQ